MKKKMFAVLLLATFSVCSAFAQKQTTGDRQHNPDSVNRVGYFNQLPTTQTRVVDESQMNNQNQVTNTMDAIRGRVAGLQVERNGSNALSAVRLRGTTSLTGGNDPLIIVDDVMGDLTLLQSVYPTDIQSFTILKDASETAQYGSRGAAGVIEIKTKRGKEGKASINYNGSFGISVPYKRLNML